MRNERIQLSALEEWCVSENVGVSGRELEGEKEFVREAEE